MHLNWYIVIFQYFRWTSTMITNRLILVMMTNNAGEVSNIEIISEITTNILRRMKWNKCNYVQITNIPPRRLDPLPHNPILAKSWNPKSPETSRRYSHPQIYPTRSFPSPWNQSPSQRSHPKLKKYFWALIRLQRIYNFWCSMLVFTPFAYCFVTLRGTFMHFPELTY
jgi:hypothetical protein